MKAINFEKVCFSYKSEKGKEEVFSEDSAFSLDGVDFAVEEGEFVAILGHNGSGKSTLARLTNGLLTPTGGDITVFGLNSKDNKNLFDIRRQVGIVFQNPDNQTVASIVEDDIAFGPENVGIKREEIGERIEFALRAVGMEAFRHSTPNRLSGGQKQRIAIAGVLALKPRVMILDESTAMLDPRGRREVMEVITRLNKEEGITVLLITHFPEEAMLADRALVMHKGKIVMQGKPSEIFSQETELEKYALTMPRPIRVCRGLTSGGLSVADEMQTHALADSILSVLKEKDCKVSEQKKESEDRVENSEERAQEESGRVLCENLSFVYNKKSPFETHALEGVNLEIKSGDFFGIIGHTGSGKSTFVQHLNALLKTTVKKRKERKSKKGKPVPKKTVLQVNGFDLTDKKTDFRKLRERVGMVFQYPEYQLFAETVFDDVAFGLKNFKKGVTEEECRSLVEEALETVGLSYEEMKKRSPFDLSGGQKRRVAIAGVIVTKPEILVLDEPSAGLDPIGKKEIMELLHKIHNDWCKTVIIVSHDMDEIAENCNRMAVFSEGKVVATGTPKQLFDDVNEIERLGLEVPFTAKITEYLRQNKIFVDNDYTTEDFVQKTLSLVKDGAKGGEQNA